MSLVLEKPKCRLCKVRPVTLMQKGKLRTTCWKCNRPNRLWNAEKRRKWRLRLMKPCEMCSYEPKSISDFEIDHIDRDRANNDDSNLMVLCKACHLNKTLLNKEYLPKSEHLVDVRVDEGDDGE